MAEAEKNEPVTLTKGELNKLLMEAAKAGAQEVKTELMVGAAKEGAAAAPNMEAFAAMFDRMAMAIAEISDQGTARKRVAPEILANRAKAHEKMVRLIGDARHHCGEAEKKAAAARRIGDTLEAERQDAEVTKWSPEYRLVAKTYLAEQLIEPFRPGPDRRPIPTEIIWKGAPNQSMKPINEVAKAIHSAFQDSIGSQENLKGMDNRPFAMTPGGVVVKGLPSAARREIPQDLLGDEVRITSQNDPTASHVRVLGTVAAPARQNVVRRADQVV